MPAQWEEIAARKRAALAEQITAEYRIPHLLVPPSDQLDVTTFPQESGWFSKKELEITESTSTHILQKIASRSWTSEEVTRAFCKRAAAAQQLVKLMRRPWRAMLTVTPDELPFRLLPSGSHQDCAIA
jgi:amidase